jgi:hypothetical protein
MLVDEALDLGDSDDAGGRGGARSGDMLLGAEAFAQGQVFPRHHRGHGFARLHLLSYEGAHTLGIAVLIYSKEKACAGSLTAFFSCPLFRSFPLDPSSSHDSTAV